MQIKLNNIKEMKRELKEEVAGINGLILHCINGEVKVMEAN